jgi:tetratricopeptide (TPR) repeat protein
MWPVRPALVLLVLLVAGGACGPVMSDVHEADRRYAEGDWREAVARYDAVAKRSGVSPEERVHALTNAGIACEHLGDNLAARQHYERAIEPDVPGASEDALYQLAELVKVQDRARALNLYYRAAAGAERNRSRAFPYHEATERILQLSMSRQ